MRFVALGAVAALTAGMLAMQRDSDQIVILGGDTQGYLSPCGCTSPMMGGMLRRATVIRNLTRPGRTTILENGGLVESSGLQDQMKAETLVQSLADVGVTAINVGPADAQLGRGELLQLSQLSGDKLVSSSISETQDHAVRSAVASGPFLVGGATEFAQAVAGPLGASPVPVDAAVKALIEAASEANLTPVLMLQGGHETAIRLARQFPSLALVQYSSIGNPPSKPEIIGSTVLATTGEHSKHVVKLRYGDGKFSGYEDIALGPEFRDDPAASRFYSTYLRRVKDAKLIEKVPRRQTPPYAGSWACMSCHSNAAHSWKGSAHRLALQTLSRRDHEVDPDCVSCHVTGLASKSGFRSLAATPLLAGVGCESCHGPGLAHVKKPGSAKLPRLTENACINCHNPLNSPNFQFEEYWRKIAHH